MFTRKIKTIPLTIFLYLITLVSLNAEITMSFVGDTMTGSDWPNKTYLPPNEAKNFFDDVKHILTNSNITFGNLEGAISDTNTTSRKRGKNSYSFRMPPYMATRLSEAGFNIMAVANNHIRDFGDRGYLQTIDYLTKNNITPVGNKLDTAVFKTVNDKKIGFLAFYYFGGANNAIQDIARAKTLIENTKKECDFLIVSFHGGAEGGAMFRVPKTNEIFLGENRGDVYKFARAAADSGANLIVGHAPHVLRAMEMYNDTFIAYSLGNFAGYKQFSTSGNNGISVILTLTFTDDLKLKKAEVTPIILKQSGIPFIDLNKTAIEKLNNYADLDFKETGIKFDSNGIKAFE